MKKLYLIVVVTVCTVLLTACGKKSEINRAELAAQINSNVTFSEQLTEIDAVSAELELFLNPNDYSGITMYSGTEATCDEFIIIDTSDTDAIVQKLNTYLEAQRANYSGYRPTEVSKLDSAVLMEYKGTVTLIISPDSEQARLVYEGYLKK